MKPRTVLLADGDPDSHNVYATMLEHHDFRVLHAHNGVDAHRIACEQRPDVIVAELFLPLVQGQPLVSLLKQDCQTVRIPVIGLTAVPRSVGVMLGLLACESSLVKPCTPTRLFEEVQRVLAQAAQPSLLSVVGAGVSAPVPAAGGAGDNR